MNLLWSRINYLHRNVVSNVLFSRFLKSSWSVTQTQKNGHCEPLSQSQMCRLTVSVDIKHRDFQNLVRIVHNGSSGPSIAFSALLQKVKSQSLINISIRKISKLQKCTLAKTNEIKIEESLWNNSEAICWSSVLKVSLTKGHVLR